MKSLFHDLCILLLIVGFITPFAHAGQTSDRNKWLQKELRLSSEQRETIKKILDKYHDQLKRLEHDAAVAKNDLRLDFRTVNSVRTTNKELLAKYEKYQELKARFRKTRFLMALDIRVNLTNDQLLTLHSLQEFSPKKTSNKGR